MEEKIINKILKAGAGDATKKNRLSFVRKFVTAITAFSLSAFVALGTTACHGKPQAPENPVNPNPPIVTPDDQENQTTDNQDQENPDDSTSNNPTPENPDDTTPENPDNPTPENPDDPMIDYDNLTPKDLTDEQKAKIVENVTTKLATNIEGNIGRSDGGINRVIAVDFEDNYINLLLDFTNSSIGNTIGLYSYEMNSNMSFQHLLTNDLTPKSSTNRGKIRIEFPAESQDARVEEIHQKLLFDNCISLTECDIDLLSIAKSIFSTDAQLNCGIFPTHIYRISKDRITSILLSVKADGPTKDYILDHLINGTKGVSYRVQEGASYEYEFSVNALYNFHGLEIQ